MQTPNDFPLVTFDNEITDVEVDIVDLAALKQRGHLLDPKPNTPHRIEFNVLMFIFSAEGAHLVDFERVPYEPASALLLTQGQVQAFDFEGDVQGKLILYTHQFLESLQATMRIPFLLSGQMAEISPRVALDNTLQARVQRLLLELETELALPRPDPAITMALFSAVFMIVTRERSNPAARLKPQDANRFRDFLTLVQRYYQQHRDAAFYADKLGMTYKTLNVLCKKVSGQTAKHYIDHYVVLEAKRRLVIDQPDIAELAFSFGFDEPTNFTKFFKRYTGVTPKQFTA